MPAALTAVNADWLIGAASGAVNRSSGAVTNLIGYRSYAYNYASTANVTNSKTIWGLTNNHGSIVNSLGIDSENNHRSGSTVTNAYAFRGFNRLWSGVNPVTNMWGARLINTLEAGTNVTNLRGLQIDANKDVTSTIQKNTGILINSITGADDGDAATQDNYAIYTNAGQVRFGDNLGVGTPANSGTNSKLEVFSSNNLFSADPNLAYSDFKIQSFTPSIALMDRSNLSSNGIDARMHLEQGKLNFEFSNDNLSEVFSPTVTLQNDGKVGIGTTTPTERLDVVGKTKTSTFQMTSGASNGAVMVSDSSGNASWDTSFSQNGNIVMSVGSSNSFLTSISSGFVKITGVSPCGRTMISMFVFNGNTLVHLNSVARNTVGSASSLNVDNTSWSVSFPGLISCGDGGTGNQFNFTISKSGGTIILSGYDYTMSKTFNLAVNR